jgi:hypothetical protein
MNYKNDFVNVKICELLDGAQLLTNVGCVCAHIYSV